MLAAADMGGITPVDLNDKGEVLGTGVIHTGFSTVAIWSSAGLRAIPDTESDCLHASCPAGVFLNNKSEALIAGPVRYGPGGFGISRGGGSPASLACGHALAFNDSNEVVAEICGEGPTYYEYFLHMVDAITGVATPIGWSGFAPRDINNPGVVVGTWTSMLNGSPDAGHAQPARLKNNNLTMLETTGFVRGAAHSINDREDIVGSVDTSTDGSHPRPSLWTASGRRTLNCPDVDGTAEDINGEGVVVGACLRRNGSSYAVRWKNGTVEDLNTLLKPEVITAGWVLTQAIRVNAQGWMLVTANQLGGNVTTVLLKP